MGKPYRSELAALPATTAEVFGLPVKPLRRAVEDLARHGIVIVASGGSQTAAEYLAQLHQARFGHPCRVVTPLVFRHDAMLAQGAVWLLSAGGRNADILGAADHAIASGALSITALVASLDSPLQARLSHYGAARTYAYALGTGADGFLATNSLWSMCLLIERAYGTDESDVAIQAQADQALKWAPGAVAQVDAWDGGLIGLADPETLIGLRDLEMRVTEAALAQVWVSDLRNLGHGRHYWFEANRANARAMCLFTEPYADLARRTLNLLSTVSPVHAFAVPGTGAAARLATIAWSMHAAAVLGDRVGRDPGRPGVPAFGEALYRLEAASQERREVTGDGPYIAAKLGLTADRIDPSVLAQWSAHLAVFREVLMSAEIRGIVADFDGTLVETAARYGPLPPPVVDHLCRLLEGGLVLGVATGRGDSCGTALRAALSPHLWDRVWVGYHNGACIQPLGVVEVPECATHPVHLSIQEVERRLRGHIVGSVGGRVRAYPTQCSLTLVDGTSLEAAWMRVHDELDDLVAAGEVRVWMSSHSIDVVMANVSKQNVVSEVAAAANCLPKQILTLGDRGRWPGNDFELLDHPLSLSSEACSHATGRCWNLAGPGRRQVAATCFHLSRLIITGPGVARFQEPAA